MILILHEIQFSEPRSRFPTPIEHQQEIKVFNKTVWLKIPGLMYPVTGTPAWVVGLFAIKEPSCLFEVWRLVPGPKKYLKYNGNENNLYAII